MGIDPKLNCSCGEKNVVTRMVFHQRPIGETHFDLKGKEYDRSFQECTICNHLFGSHDLDLTDLYRGSYTDATYSQGIRAAFDRIMALPNGASDNEARVRRIEDFVRENYGASLQRKLLDIGSGLAVFPARMNELGWICSVIDPDSRAVEHAEDVASAVGYCGSFEEVKSDLDRDYSLISLNKVLEHVEDPMQLLLQLHDHLEEKGLVYIEVPDATRALATGLDREEFFIEHHHGFSDQSLLGLVHRAGFLPLRLTSLHEPSGKFTLVAFAQAHS